MFQSSLKSLRPCKRGPYHPAHAHLAFAVTTTTLHVCGSLHPCRMLKCKQCYVENHSGYSSVIQLLMLGTCFESLMVGLKSLMSARENAAGISGGPAEVSKLDVNAFLGRPSDIALSTAYKRLESHKRQRMA